MSSSNVARTNDAAVLAALDGTGRRTALLRLDGELGGIEAAHAKRSVDTIRQAAQARRLALPDLSENARARRAAAIAGNRAPLPDTDFRHYWAAEEEWQIFVGVHVTFQRHNDDHTQYLTAVVLEVIHGTVRGDAPGVVPRAQAGLDEPRLRLGLSCEALGHDVGDATVISARHWHCSPSPAELVAAISRDTRRRGRPLYAEADVPTEVLATPGELTLRRKRPATLQPPIASVRRSRGATDLYAILDAEDLPTPAQTQPSIDQRRTCATCGRTSPSPWRSTADGARHCPDHHDAARLRVDTALVARNRAVSAVWAREVLADPDTVLVAMLGAPEDLRVRVEDLTGNALLQESIATVMRETRRRRLAGQPPVTPPLVPDWVYSDRAGEVSRRRAIVTSSYSAHSAYTILGEVASASRFSVKARRGDDFARRLQVWNGRASLKGVLETSVPFGGAYTDSAEAESALELASVITETRQNLTAMAGTAMTEQQPDHATKLHHDRRAAEYPFFWSKDRERRTRARTAEAVALFGQTSTPDSVAHHRAPATER